MARRNRKNVAAKQRRRNDKPRTDQRGDAERTATAARHRTVVAAGGAGEGQRAEAGRAAAALGPTIAVGADEGGRANAEQPALARLTMEQRRAKHAWEKCEGYKEDYVNLAKGLPALIMNSGLMQTMAFLHEKGSKERQRHCRDLAGHLRGWLHERFPDVPSEFEGFMTALMEADTRKFQAVTTEAFAWLRWMRQMAAARVGEN